MSDEDIERVVAQIRSLLSVLALLADQRGMIGLQESAARFEAEVLSAITQPDDSA